jgi:membrane-associated phospholipid phosphatase
MNERRAALRVAAIAVLLLIAAHLLDGWFYAHVVNERVYEEDWGRLLRVMGYAPTWVVAAVALVLHDWPLRTADRVMPAFRRGLLLVGGVAAGGIAAELLKLLFRRERPRAHEGEYFFRAFSDRPLHSGGLALPSSHALVAFAAAAVLARLFPRAAPVWYLLALGCGLSRVAAQAHFLSDIAMAGIVAWLVVAGLWRWLDTRAARSTGETVRPSNAPVPAAPPQPVPGA